MGTQYKKMYHMKLYTRTRVIKPPIKYQEMVTVKEGDEVFAYSLSKKRIDKITIIALT